MIRHIFTIIWNERRSNLWILLEFVLVFCILWFCSDYIISVQRTYKSAPGFDISDTYILRMQQQLTTEDQGEVSVDQYGLALTLLDRVKHHPDIEYITLGNFAVPYLGGASYGSMYINRDELKDSLYYSLRLREVTSDFFNVFKVPILAGRVFHEQDAGDKNTVLISTLGDGKFGSHPWLPLLPVDEIKTLAFAHEAPEQQKKVIGITGKFNDALMGAYVSSVFQPLPPERIHILYNQIAVRVKPGTDEHFPERFMKDMSEQLTLSPYYLASVKPTRHYEALMAKNEGITGDMNGVYAVAIFLVTNIFLGILGTFWVRTQTRRREIGLRISLGASKRKVLRTLLFETLLLLGIACIIGTIICLALGGTSFISSLGLPDVNREAWRIGWEQDLINFSLTTAFLVIVSVIAVWYPARKAAQIQPARVLHEE